MFKIPISGAFLFACQILLAQSSLNVKLLDNWHDESLVTNSSLARYNDCWGFVWQNQEYAVAGSTEGSHFFRLSDDDQLIEIDSVTARYSHPGVIHRDFKSYRNYVYGVCDEGISSLQIIDISALPNSVSKVADLGGNFGRVHNLYIDTNRALLFACGVRHESGGVISGTFAMEVYSLQDPVNPALLYTGPSDIPIVHDIFIRDEYAYLNCGYDGLRVYNFSNPSNPIFVQNLDVYQDQGYNHQGWMTPDGKWYIFGDETTGKRLKKCAVAPNMQLSIQSVFGTNFQNGSVAHNVMLSNDFAFIAYYNEGLRIYDIRGNGANEIAHYDTYPENSAFNMNGAWGVYSDLPSGRILVSDRQNGLFLLDFREEFFSSQLSQGLHIYPNPAASGQSIFIRTPEDVSEFIVDIFDLSGRPHAQMIVHEQNFAEMALQVAAGIYVVKIRYIDYSDDLIVLEEKIVVQ